MLQLTVAVGVHGAEHVAVLHDQEPEPVVKPGQSAATSDVFGR
jgi:hypothetical protein